jgi:hypothetical protein
LYWLQALCEILSVGNYRNDKFGRSGVGACSRINVLIAKRGFIQKRYG